MEHKSWSSGKLDDDKPFDVFYDMKVMNAEVSAKGLEKCSPLTRLPRQNVEILDDYGCPKNSNCCWRRKSKQFVDLLQLPSPTQNKASLCQEESKGVWRMGYATFKLVNFVRFILFVFTAKLILSSRHDIFHSIHFEKLR